jgi:hypothetical protein
MMLRVLQTAVIHRSAERFASPMPLTHFVAFAVDKEIARCCCRTQNVGHAQKQCLAAAIADGSPLQYSAVQQELKPLHDRGFGTHSVIANVRRHRNAHLKCVKSILSTAGILGRRELIIRSKDSTILRSMSSGQFLRQRIGDSTGPTLALNAHPTRGPLYSITIKQRSGRFTNPVNIGMSYLMESVSLCSWSNVVSCLNRSSHSSPH